MPARCSVLQKRTPRGAQPSGLLLIALLQLAACARAADTLLVATTTSLDDTGLLDSLLVGYRAAADVRVRTLVVGSGEALALGRRRDVDVILAHSPDDELQFMAEGHGVLRVPVFATDYVLVGPSEDPAGARDAGSVLTALGAISATGEAFVSRGDRSGTHRMEESLWEAALAPGAARRPAARHHIEAGLGMAETLRLASERQAYTLSDRATFALLAPALDLVIIYEDPAELANVYSVIVVRGGKNPTAAQHFAGWLRSDAARRHLAQIRSGGSRLFRPIGDTPD